MITCPNCGTQNEPGAHFCAECGADLGTLAAPPSSTQPVSSPEPGPLAGRPEWVPGQGWVKPVQPLTPPADGVETGRRSWLWVVLMAVALLIVLCCVSSIYFSTDRGTHQLNRLSTWSAEHK